MSEQENMMIVRKTFDNLNDHKLDLNDQYLGDSVRVEAAGSLEVMNKDQGKMYTRRFVDAFPDLHFDLKDIIAQGDKVATTWVAKGTHSKPLQTISGDTIPPTNKSVMTPGSTIYEFRNNKIIRQEIYWDQVAFLSQLGLLKLEEISSRVRR